MNGIELNGCQGKLADIWHMITVGESHDTKTL